MGACFTKKTACSAPIPQEVKPNPEHEQPKKKENAADVPVVATPTEKKEFVVIKHPDEEEKQKPNPPIAADAESGKAQARSSSCSKEEVDAILIQCGRLSRSSSAGKVETPSRARRYSGSKRSFDFDTDVGLGSKNEDNEEVVVVQREPRLSSPSSSRRRRRRSRESDQQQQRSGSKERGIGSGNGGGRRVSRSPNRRSESPIPNSTGNRPGKMVSVPATEKTNNNGSGAEAVEKRIQVKRDAAAVGVVSRSAASPRSRSPARANLRVLNDNQQQQQPLSLSRSNSRKAENSPYRRNPLAEMDNNTAGFEQSSNKKPNVEKMTTSNKSNNAVIVIRNCIGKDDAKPHQAVTRSRSSRLSRDLDINPETLMNQNPPSYASLLLEDIQNFHQKNATAPAAAFTISMCVSKACSILEAVADLNKKDGKKENVLESEIVVNDDLMEPSLHKYVTVKRGVDAAADIEDQESSGSNSFVGSQHLSWLSSSSSDPNSADGSINCSTFSKSNTRLGCSDRVEKKRELGNHPRNNGIGRGTSAYSVTTTTTVAST